MKGLYRYDGDDITLVDGQWYFIEPLDDALHISNDEGGGELFRDGEDEQQY